MVTGVFAFTAVVVILKPADVVAPAANLTDAGSDATAGLLLVSVTVAPAEGAGASSVTVFVAPAGAPPTTDNGERFSVATPSGVTVRVAVARTPESAAVIVT
jgi:hypothetical protein